MLHCSSDRQSGDGPLLCHSQNTLRASDLFYKLLILKWSVLDLQYAPFLQIIHFLQYKGNIVSQFLKLCNWYLKQNIQVRKHETS